MTQLNEAQLLVTVLDHSPLSEMCIAAYQAGDLKTNLYLIHSNFT